MDASSRVAQLLAQGVPLTLLFDIAGVGPTSAELLYEECFGARAHVVHIATRPGDVASALPDPVSLIA